MWNYYLQGEIDIMNKKLFNILVGLAFGFFSYIIHEVALTTIQIHSREDMLAVENVFYFFCTIYGILTACLFKGTFPERLLRIIVKPVAVFISFLITFDLRNAIYKTIGFVPPESPGDGMEILMLYLFMFLGTVIGLIIMWIITAVKDTK